jgi:hypothetical protein
MVYELFIDVSKTGKPDANSQSEPLLQLEFLLGGIAGGKGYR